MRSARIAGTWKLVTGRELEEGLPSADKLPVVNLGDFYKIYSLCENSSGHMHCMCSFLNHVSYRYT